MIKVFLLNLPVVLELLKLRLSFEADFALVGQTSDNLEAIYLIKQLQPDVIVMGLLKVGEIEPLEFIRHVGKQYPQSGIVVWSSVQKDDIVRECLRRGAKAYVAKSSPESELVRGIREAACGRKFLSSLMLKRAIGAYLETG